MEKSKTVIPERFKDHRLFTGTVCGTNFGFMAKRGYYLRPEVAGQPELMEKAGINWTTLNLNFCQDRYTSDKVYLDFEYSSGEYEISETVKRLHDHGVSVLFKPCLTNLDGVWMGKVSFPSPKHSNQIAGVKNSYAENWFRSYIEAYKYFCELAERTGMEAMMIGCEYLGLECEDAYWRRVIEEVRGRYSQPITYEFTPESLAEGDPKWMEELDFLSFSFYPAAADEKELPEKDLLRLDPTAMKPKTVEEMRSYLEKTQKEKIGAISRRFGSKPIAFTEYGTRSSHGNILRPYTTRFDSYYDGKEQADYMEASFETFDGIPQWMGMFWWKWDETQYRPHYHTDPNGDKGFTIQGKPAEEVMRLWCKKSRAE
ncbi:MAG: hypothetical protein IJV00_00425 [Clostridia bacterium]|nr:hypothetical protein [Clostridia bacterium]